jgi:diguanylate cyclase (GGDEF)-like protein
MPAVVYVVAILVLGFSAWDYLIDPAHVLQSTLVRFLGMALLLTQFVRFQRSDRKTRVSRVIVGMYVTTYLTLIAALAFLKDGFNHGLPGLILTTMSCSAIFVRARDVAWSIPLIVITMLLMRVLQIDSVTLINSLVYLAASVGITWVYVRLLEKSNRRAFLLEQQLERDARTDSLTGVYIRRHLSALAEAEIQRAKRFNRPLSVILLDIDHFKRVNDTYGHDVGDEAIRATAALLQQNLRTTDYLGRMGGEEFAALLAETTGEQAMALAERLRKLAEEQALSTPHGLLRFTISLGVASFSPANPNWEALLKAADDALYEAKRGGRNQVVWGRHTGPQASTGEPPPGLTEA